MNSIGHEDLKTKREIYYTTAELIEFETEIADDYGKGKISGPIHLSDGNEEILIKIFSKISEKDWVFSAWRNHYHALLHGVEKKFLQKEITDGRSMGIINRSPKFYSSSIVGGILPICLGAALSIKRKGGSESVWCFIGDMTYETGLFWEAYKFSQNFELPLRFVVEDNEKSVTTNTERSWGARMAPLKNIIYYKYTSKYPHHGTGQWVNF